jgi:hypothetical protein
MSLKGSLGTLGDKNIEQDPELITALNKQSSTKPSLMLKCPKNDKGFDTKISLKTSLSDSLTTPKLATSSLKRAANVNERIIAETKGEEFLQSPQSQLHEKINNKKQADKATINPRQYMVTLDRFLNKQNSYITKDVVLDVSSSEIERVIKLSARVRGRYLAKVLDIGSSEKGGLKGSELIELRHCRESYEELFAGISILKDAISDGDLIVTGRVQE